MKNYSNNFTSYYKNILKKIKLYLETDFFDMLNGFAQLELINLNYLVMIKTLNIAISMFQLSHQE